MVGDDLFLMKTYKNLWNLEKTCAKIKFSMKLPIIKHLTQFIEDNDEDFVVETIETLEALTEVPSLKDEELDDRNI